MDLEKWFKETVEEVKDTFEYKLEGYKIEIALKMVEKMEEKGINRTELARRLGVSSPFVTKILRGTNNFTLATLLRICEVLGLELKIELEAAAEVAAKKATKIEDNSSQDNLELERETTKTIKEIPGQLIDFEKLRSAA